MVNRYRMLLLILFLSAFFIPLIPLDKALADVPVVTEVRVADVTTRSFSVVWISSESATANLRVYDASCSTDIITVPGDSRDNNVVKATAIGLEPATTYCFQTETTSVSTSQLTISAQQLVNTESQTTRTYCIDAAGYVIDCQTLLQDTSILPFGNDLIYHPVYGSNQTLDTGAILMVSISPPAGSSYPGSSYPISTRAAHLTVDGLSLPGAIVDLNNIFSVATRENMNLVGGERMRLQEIRGANGCTLERWRKVPQDIEIVNGKVVELVEVKDPGACFIKEDLDCNDTIDIVDIRRDARDFGKVLGGDEPCFNSDMDIDGDGDVDIVDIRGVARRYGQHP